jgi:two-component system response regulator YesN
MPHIVENRSFLYLDTIVVLMMLGSTSDMHRIILEINQICKGAMRILEANVTAGIGQPVAELSEIAKSYQEASDAVDYRVLLEPNQAIYSGDIQPEVNRDFVLDDQDIQRVIKAVKLEDKEEVTKSVRDLIAKLRNSKISLRRYQVSMMEVVTELLKLGRSYHLDLEEIFGGNMDFYGEIANFDSLDSLGDWLCEMCMRFRSLIRQERTDSTKLLTDKAKQFIRENYAQSNLSVEVLCGHLNVSAAYFSTIFKKETGESFVSYLTSVRMEAALELLNNTRDKTYVIAEKVGYTEPNYFSYVFRKQYGMSPTQYRASRTESHEGEN